MLCFDLEDRFSSEQLCHRSWDRETGFERKLLEWTRWLRISTLSSRNSSYIAAALI